jgi:hypothetical protein
VSDVRDVFEAFGGNAGAFEVNTLAAHVGDLSPVHRRSSATSRTPVFHQHRSETELLRYIHRLQARICR